MRSLHLIEGDWAIISPGLQLFGPVMECWRCESRCKLTPECFLYWPIPLAVAMFSILPHLDLEVREKAILPKPRGQQGGGHVLFFSLSSFPHLFQFLVFSSQVWNHVPVVSSLTHLSHLSPISPSQFYAFCPYSHPSGLLSNYSLFQSNKVNRQGYEHRNPN